MATTLIASHEIEVDAEGFLQKPEQWSEEIGTEIAREAGIAPLTDRHWQVIRFMRDRYLTTGQAVPDDLEPADRRRLARLILGHEVVA